MERTNILPFEPRGDSPLGKERKMKREKEVVVEEAKAAHANLVREHVKDLCRTYHVALSAEQEQFICDPAISKEVGKVAKKVFSRGTFADMEGILSVTDILRRASEYILTKSETKIDRIIKDHNPQNDDVEWSDSDGEQAEDRLRSINLSVITEETTGIGDDIANALVIRELRFAIVVNHIDQEQVTTFIKAARNAAAEEEPDSSSLYDRLTDPVMNEIAATLMRVSN